jgi:hypothetical protein
MIESLVAPAATEAEGAQPLRHSLVFDRITFKDGKLWQPCYPSLIRYHLGMSGLQWEPGFRICTKDPMEIEITFEIEEGQGVTFVREGEGVKCRAISSPLDPEIPGLAEARWESETRCTLVWNQSAANDRVKQRFQDSEVRQKVVALRLFCQGGNPPADEWEEAVTAVEGGLYLAILYNPSDAVLSRTVDLSRRDPGPEPPEPPERPTIRIMDIDPQRRPVYDLFHPLPEGFPLELEPEPTYRAREGETIELDLNLDLPTLGLRWRALPGVAEGIREAEVTPFSPENRPRQLQTCEILPGGKTCRIRWSQQTGRSTCITGTPDSSQCYCTTGQVSSFLFNAAASLLDLERLRQHFNLRDVDEAARLLARVAIDPTVIEPPSCTSDGHCIPPPREQ